MICYDRLDIDYFQDRCPSNTFVFTNTLVRLVYEPIPNEGNYEGDLYSRILKNLDASSTR